MARRQRQACMDYAVGILRIRVAASHADAGRRGARNASTPCSRSGGAACIGGTAS